VRPNVVLGLVIASSVATMFIAARERDKPAPPKPARHVVERPWLSHEDAAQLVDEDGALGPLFDGIDVGGRAPTPEQRAKVQAFARAHALSIDFKIAHDELLAVRLAVTYGGCCGYEGADWLANRLGRWSTGSCCVCGENTLTNDWAHGFDAGVHLRASVRVNRVEATWSQQLTAEELVERADALLGQQRDKVALAPTESWHSLGSGYYRLELPYPMMENDPITGSAWLASSRPDLGIIVHAERGTIVDVAIDVRANREPLERALTARYGHRRHDESWRRAGRIVRHDYEYLFTLA
jgi:hypothetical protein